MANRRFIDFPIASTVGDNDIILIWQDGLNKQTTKATILTGISQDLASLTDVDLTGLTNGQILRYNSVTSKWENTDQGNLDLNDLNDVTIVSPSNGQVLVYNSSTSKWENSSGGYVPYVGAVTTVDLGAQQLKAGHTTLTTNGSTETLTINHTSGSGKAINVTKGGNGEGLYINKTSGSGNAATIVGTLQATTLKKTGGTSSQFLKADGSVDSTTYQNTADKGQPNGYASLDGNGKVPLTQINDALIGNVNFQGLWNASTNTPTLVDPPSSGTKGYYYIVSTGGTFAGITFEVGDWIISNGTAWGKVDNTDAVSSVFGRTGNVVASNGDYNTSQVTESGNLYYTDARSRAALSFAAGSGAYNSGTGVITIPTNNNQITNGAGYITSAALSGYLPLTGGTLTGALNGTSATFSGIIKSSASSGAGQIISEGTATNGEGTFTVIGKNSSGTERSAIFKYDNEDVIRLGTSSPINLRFETNDAERMRITLDGAMFMRRVNSDLTFADSVGGLYVRTNGNEAGNQEELRVFGRNIGFYSHTGSRYASITSLGNLRVNGTGFFDSSLTASSIIRSGGTSSQYLMADGSVSTLSNPVTGTGTTNYLPKFTGASTIGNSLVFDNGTNVGINTTTPNDFIDGERGMAILQSTNGRAVLSLVGTRTDANEALGRISFTNSNSTNIGSKRVSYISGVRGSTNNSGYLEFAVANDALGSPQMVLSQLGNLLVGASNQSSDNGARLQVSGEGKFYQPLTNTTSYLTVENNRARNAAIRLKTTVGDYYLGTGIGADVNQFQIFDGTAGENRLTINSTGAATFSSSVTATSGIFTGSGTGNLDVITISNFEQDDSGDETANLAFQLTRSYTNSLSPAGYIKVGKERPWSVSGGRQSFMSFFTRNGAADPEERMRITSSGNVWIGNDTNPLLEIANGGSTDVLSGIRWAIGGSRVDYGGIYSAASSANNNYISFYTKNSASAPSERMRITSSGNVLIGSPPAADNGARLQVSGAIKSSVSSGGSVVTSESTATNGEGQFVIIGKNSSGTTRSASFKYDNADIIRLGTSSNISMRFETNDAERMRLTSDGAMYMTRVNSDLTFADSVGGLYVRTNGNIAGNAEELRVFGRNIAFFSHSGSRFASINSNGNVLIGTTAVLNGPVQGKLDVVYNGVTHYGMNIKTTHSEGIAISFNNSSSTQVGRIFTNSSSTSYITSSDYRLKKDLKDFNGLDLIYKIKTYDFEWTTNRTRSYGVLAHELQEVINYAVHGQKDSITMQGVDYSKLVPILIKSIQELKQEIDTLKN